MPAVRRAVDLDKRLEKTTMGLLRNANASIGNFNPHMTRASLSAGLNSTDRDLAAVGEFYSVAQQVHQSLPKPTRISRYDRGHRGIDLTGQVQLLAFRRFSE